MSEYKFDFNEETRKYCRENLNETEESRQHCFNELKQWALENPKFHINTDETALIPFLRGCKFNLDLTKKKLENYYKLRRDAPEWFSNRNPSLNEIQELTKLGVFVPLRKHYNNQMIVLIRTAVHNPRYHKQDDVFKTGFMLLDIASKEIELAQIYGVIAIFDMKNISYQHARQLTTTMIKRVVQTWQNYHCRPKNLEFIHAPYYINVVLNIFRSFMSEKLKKRIHVHHSSLDSLYKAVPKEYLPRDYGGDCECLDDTIDYWSKKLFEHSNWFSEDEKYKAE